MNKRNQNRASGKFKVISGEKSRHSNIKRLLPFYLAICLVAVLLFQSGYHWIGSYVLSRRLNVAPAEPGVMDDSTTAQGMIIRREQVIKAPVSGVIVEMAPPGERVSAGMSLVTLAVISREEVLGLAGSQPGEEEKTIWLKIIDTIRGLFAGSAEEEPGEEEQIIVSGEIPPWVTEHKEIVSEFPGLLSYTLDGLESREEFSFPGNFAPGDSEPAFSYTEGAFVEEGRPLLKIVDNWSWSYCLSLPLDQGRTAAAYETVKIEFDFAPGRKVEARIKELEIDSRAEQVYIRYELDTQLAGFEEVRCAEATIIFRRRQGLVITEEALLEHAGIEGVFLNRGGTVAFEPVKVIRLQEGKALVEGIEPYSMVIGRPDLVEEGQRLD